MTKKFTINHDDGHAGGHITVREFKYDGDDGTFAATIDVGNTNSGEKAGAMLSREQTVELIEALQAVIDQPINDDPAAVVQRVIALADKWDQARQVGDGAPSIVARAFADELRKAITG